MLDGFLKKYSPDRTTRNVNDLHGEDKNIEINKQTITEAVIEGVKAGAEENNISPSSEFEQIVDIKEA